MTMEYASENADVDSPKAVCELGERGHNQRHPETKAEGLSFKKV